MLIQKLRLQRGWSQEQLATISGLSTRTIQRLERGQPASLETMNTLAAVFEVDLSQLTDQKEAEMPNYVASHTEA
ncbi:helix-turn-helix domain-containing protein [Agrobacterium sp. Azo12]|nr:helix-turn-helix transcriptional regulator [Agrobacterium sp. Azo12]MDO5896711.1 helix-turn-helix transcriptional regulator [Agrobacterium sp. Azo12]